jgi:hypothetical protein
MRERGFWLWSLEWSGDQLLKGDITAFDGGFEAKFAVDEKFGVEARED